MAQLADKINENFSGEYPISEPVKKVLKLDHDQAIRHVRALGIEEGEAVLIVGLSVPPTGVKSQRELVTIERQPHLIQSMIDDDRSVFMLVNENDGTVERKKGNMVRVRAVWAELDDGWPEGDFPLKPTIVIESSPGKYHAYFVLEPGSSLPWEDFDAIQDRLVESYGADTQAKDGSRILRLAGTWHLKPDKKTGIVTPFQTRIVDELSSRARYTADELLQAFPPLTKKRLLQQMDTLNNIAKAISEFDPEFTAAALAHIDPNPRGKWVDVGMAIHHASGGSDEGFKVWSAWAQTAKPEVVASLKDHHERWRGFETDRNNPLTMGSIVAWARESGFDDKAWRAEHRSYARALDVVEPRAEHLTFDDDLTALEFGTRQAKWNEALEGEMLRRMNNEHAVVSIGSKVRFLHTAPDREGNSELRFLGREDMRRLYDAVVVKGDPTKPKTVVTAFDLWERWPKRRRYAGIGFFPGSPCHPPKVPKDYLNLWRGFAIDPRPGDWSLFKAHLRDKVCGGDDTLFNWVMDWLAQMVQAPQVKMGSAIVLRSPEKGTGKSLVLRFVQRIFGQHARTASHLDHIVGKFNGHLEDTVFFGVEEGFWAGNKQASSTLKTMITEPTLAVERKGLDSESKPNFTRVMFVSNEDWVVPVGTDERRFLVLDVKNDKAKQKSYFEPIFDQMENKGGLEAMLHELLQRQITSDLRNPPSTDALMKQRAHSLDGPQRWLLHTAQEAEVDDGSCVYSLEDGGSIEVPTKAVMASASRMVDRYEGRSLETRIGDILAKVGVEKEPRMANGRRGYVYRFPTLATFRANVSKVLGLPIEHDGGQPQTVGGGRRRGSPR